MGSWGLSLGFFLVGCVAGYFLEGLWHKITVGGFEPHPSLAYGPFNLVYGVGAMCMELVSRLPAARTPIGLALLTMLAGTLVEYGASLFNERALGIALWDYGEQPANLFGRVSLKMSLIWGGLGLVAGSFVFPLLRPLFSPLADASGLAPGLALALSFALNIALSWWILSAWAKRKRGLEPANWLARAIHRSWDDSRVEGRFPQARLATPAPARELAPRGGN